MEDSLNKKDEKTLFLSEAIDLFTNRYTIFYINWDKKKDHNRFVVLLNQMFYTKYYELYFFNFNRIHTTHTFFKFKGNSVIFNNFIN